MDNDRPSKAYHPLLAGCVPVVTVAAQIAGPLGVVEGAAKNSVALKLMGYGLGGSGALACATCCAYDVMFAGNRGYVSPLLDKIFDPVMSFIDTYFCDQPEDMQPVINDERSMSRE